MNLYLLMITIISLIGIKINLKEFNEEYLSKENTSCIKGIFILIVFYSHLQTYIPYQPTKDGLIFFVVKFLGQLMVTMFLFYSGYGIYESIKNKKNYIKSIPKKRIIKTLLNFDLAVLTFLIINIFFNTTPSIEKTIMALIGWESIGNSNWYIFGILALYFTTYISFTLFDKNKKAAFLSQIALTLLLMIFLNVFKQGQTYWYNTMLCYPLGMIFSLYKEQITNYMKNNKKYIPIVLISAISFILFKKSIKYNYIFYYLMTISFTLSIVFATMKIQFKSKALKWFGDNLFWVYILQRIPMMILHKLNYANGNAYRTALISFIATIVLTLIYSKFQKIIEIKTQK